MRSEHRKALTILILVLCALLTAGGLLGCGSEGSGSPPSLGQKPVGEDPADDGGGGDPTPAGTLTLTVEPSAVTAGDAGAAVVAVITGADGAAVANTAVTFSVGPTTVASLASTTAITDADGRAQGTVSGLRAGTATVNASAGTLSDSAPLTVVGPLLTTAVAPEGGHIQASSPSGTGATVTVTVTDQGGQPLEGQTVAFSTTLGILDAASRLTDAQGQAQVKLTSQEVGEALVTASVLGETSQAVSVIVDPAPLDTLVLGTSANTIPSNGTATITVQAEDAFGNPLDGVDVTLTATQGGTQVPTGSLDPQSITLAGGQGQSIFIPSEQGVARIRAAVGGTEVAFIDVSVELILAGEPARIQFDVTDEGGQPIDEITVKGSGGTESATIAIRVTDVNGDPIADVASNVEVEIVSGPGGGETLDGLAGVGRVRTLSTQGGQAVTVLQSGTRPGTVEIEVRVTKDSRGSELTSPLAASVPRITIRSGPPASLFLTPANAISSPGLAGQGSITHDYLAFVSDLWGNAVPDDTIVFFSQFLNVLVECRTRSVFSPLDPLAADGYVVEDCADGTITPSSDPQDRRATFTSGRGLLDPGTISAGDTLVIITEDNPHGFGGYRVSEVVDANTVRLDSNVATEVSGLQWAVGNNANLGGGVFTTEGEAATVGGVARWSNTYAGELVNSPVYIYAEAEGGTQGHARFFRLAWLADTEMVQTSGPENGDSVTAGAQYFFSFQFEDASAPTPYAIPDLYVTVSSTGGDLDFMAGDPAFLDFATFLQMRTDERSIAAGDPGGDIRFFWTVPDTAVTDDEFSVSISGGGAIQKIDLTVQ